MTRTFPRRIAIRDVGPRDGLQPEAPVEVADRVRLVDALVAAGLGRVEVAAFVSPKAVPAMAGAAEVIAAIPPTEGLVRTALVPNRRGAELALDAGVDEITVTISASATYNERNVRMSVAESEAEIRGIVDLAGGAVAVDAVVSCSFGSPYEGDIAPEEVVALADRLTGRGVDRVTFADTTGMATPRRIDDLVDALAGDIDGIGLHLHDTRGMALANAYAAMERGVARFDTSVGGLGGSPFAHGAGGNLATESLVALCDDLGIVTGIDLAALLDAAALIGDLVGRPLPSAIAHHGPPRPTPGSRGDA